jgi:predicted CoA-binding protein
MSGTELQSDGELKALLERSRRVAVLGIKTEAQAGQPAYSVPHYLQQAGYEVIPVPVYYPEATHILGEKVYRRLADIPGTVDLVNVFRRPGDIGPHVEDILSSGAKAAWFQLGIRNDEAARRLREAGLDVVQDRCILVEHRRLMR